MCLVPRECFVDRVDNTLPRCLVVHRREVGACRLEHAEARRPQGDKRKYEEAFAKIFDSTDYKNFQPSLDDEISRTQVQAPTLNPPTALLRGAATPILCRPLSPPPSARGGRERGREFLTGTGFGGCVGSRTLFSEGEGGAGAETRGGSWVSAFEGVQGRAPSSVRFLIPIPLLSPSLAPSTPSLPPSPHPVLLSSRARCRQKQTEDHGYEPRQLNRTRPSFRTRKSMAFLR